VYQIQKRVVLPAVSPDKGRGVGGDGRHTRAVAKAALLRRGIHLED